MIRVVLDANVVVSAVLKSRSKPGAIIELVRERAIELLVSEKILSEVEATLLYPRLKKLHGRDQKWIRNYLNQLFLFARHTPGLLRVDAIEADPSDNIYLACAVEGKADFIISGDKHLKDLGVFDGIRIVDPYTFLELVRQGEE